jgi:hypothetical protein
VLKLIGGGKKIGLGGSMTTAELGLPEALTKARNTIITHKPEMSDAERIKTWLEAQAADFYIASPQAVTAGGKMIFLDGLGNRAAAILYGPGKVILLAGINKLVKDTEEGLWRMRNVAATAKNRQMRGLLLPRPHLQRRPDALEKTPPDQLQGPPDKRRARILNCGDTIPNSNK